MKIFGLLLALTAAGAWLGQDAQQDMVRPKTQEVFDLARLVAQGEQADRYWTTFLDRATMQCGVYHLPAGAEDPQGAHELDEVYVVMKGKAKLVAGGEEFDAGPGSIFFVERKIDHRFFDIDEDLTVVVFFPKMRDEDR